MMRMRKKLKVAGLVFVLIPIAFFLIFAVGESAGGDLSGLMHLIQVVPFVFLAVLTWKYPKFGGWFLLFFAGLIFVISRGEVTPVLIIGTGISAVAGLLFLASTKKFA